MSLFRPSLTETTFGEGTVLWERKKLTSEVYFPVSGLVSIVVAMSDGGSVEVASIGLEGAACAGFDGDQSDFNTRGLVQIGGRFVRLPMSQLFAAKENTEIENLIAFCRDWILMQAQQEAGCTAVHSADKQFCRWLFQACERVETDTLDTGDNRFRSWDQAHHRHIDSADTASGWFDSVSARQNCGFGSCSPSRGGM